jgi:hypothetical protein
MLMLKEITIACTLVVSLAVAAPAQNNWNWHKALSAAKTIEIKNVGGDINASATSGNEG